ncbi:MAG TPA: alpha/beta hydrolase-fold protein [Acidobacteriota bacterium]|nr:alpha/beta hydrolase-fold protein [Acidobacteriota bacterium]
MPRHAVLFAIFLVSALLTVLGCDDRGTGVPVTSYESWGVWPTSDHSFDRDLALQLNNDGELWTGSTYIPSIAMPPPTGQSKPVPVLILLPPQNGDQLYFLRAGLLELAQEMIEAGEIVPMVIHCPANASAFGGFFYGNSMPAGRADSIIGDRMITEYLATRIPAIIETLRCKRGIGGVGMGGYGALRAAMKHPDMFGSITVSDGPLDFDGADGNSGLMDLFDDALAEQLNIADYSKLDTSIVGIDTTIAPIDTFTYRKFDSGRGLVTLPLSRLFIGGSLAFSPHDTLVDWVYNYQGNYTINQRFSITDSSTLIDRLVGKIEDPQSKWDFHLPFDSLGQVADSIWPLWMTNNLDSIYAQMSTVVGYGPLDSINIWIGRNVGMTDGIPDAKWNYYEMTESWVNTLTQVHGLNVNVYDYSSLDAEPVRDDEYAYDLLRQMLLFHSKCFEK